jgi:hypothetical protein
MSLAVRASQERGTGIDRYYRLDELLPVLPSQFCNTQPAQMLKRTGLNSAHRLKFKFKNARKITEFRAIP